MRHPVRWLALLALLVPSTASAQAPFGTLREQAAVRQAWLAERLDSLLPALMRREGIDMWVVPMREYNEDPVFRALVAPTTFAARRRTIYVLFDRGAEQGVERLALGGSDQGGLYTVIRDASPPPPGGGGRPREPWGPEQWVSLRTLVEARQPRVIAINTSPVFAFGDGLTHAEHEAMREALGPWTDRIRPAGALPVDLLAGRSEAEAAVFTQLNAQAWALIEEMFSRRVITPGTTRTSELVWWFRQRAHDLGYGTWFQPTVDVQRAGTSTAELGDDPVIQPGDVLHCDVGLVALGLHTDTQHMAYVPRAGETGPPAGLTTALHRANRLQDLLLAAMQPGRTGNEVLAAAQAAMRAEGIDGTIYTHPIGLHGHGAGPLIGLWDRQDGVPGRGDHRLMAGTWFAIELQATTPVPEWGGQPVRMALEEDAIVGADGVVRWAHARQDRLHVVR